MLADEREIIPADESFTGEEIDLSLHPQEVQEKIREFQRGYTRTRQKEKEELREWQRKYNEAKELADEYMELLNDDDFIQWVLEQKAENEEEGEEESNSGIEELRKEIENLKQDITTEKIKSSFIELDDYIRENNLPSIEDVMSTMLKIAGEKSRSSPDGRCNLTIDELYHLAIREKIPTLSRERIPHLETSNSSVSSGKSDVDEIFNKILKFKRGI